MAKSLTALSVERFKPEHDRLEVPDGLLPGFYLIVQPSGVKSWAVRYRYNGKPRKHTLGGYPKLTLEDARAAARQAFLRVHKGDDPAHEKKLERTRQAEAKDEFEPVARQFIERYQRPRNRSWQETARLLGLVPDPDNSKALATVKTGIVSRWHDRKIGDVRRADVVLVLDDLVDRGAPIVANRTLAALRKLFAWAMERYPIEANPCSAVKPPAKEKTRDRVLADDELRAVWKTCEGKGHFGAIIRLLILTGQRRDEVAGMAWSELKLEQKLWTLPRGRVKNDNGHDVPLSAAALAIIETLPRIKGQGLIFSTTGTTVVSGFSKVKDRIDEVSKVANWRLHDIRRTVATGMAKLGIALPVIEKALNHTSGSFRGIVGVYQRHEFSDEKRAALEAWGRFVTALVEEKPAAKVVKIGRRS